MKHSVESLQSLGYAKVPSPPWVAVNRIMMPRELADAAALIIIDCFGEKEIREIVGGR